MLLDSKNNNHFIKFIASAALRRIFNHLMRYINLIYLRPLFLGYDHVTFSYFYPLFEGKVKGDNDEGSETHITADDAVDETRGN